MTFIARSLYESINTLSGLPFEAKCLEDARFCLSLATIFCAGFDVLRT
jgi:hypothetical protein